MNYIDSVLALIGWLPQPTDQSEPSHWLCELEMSQKNQLYIIPIEIRINASYI